MGRKNPRRKAVPIPDEDVAKKDEDQAQRARDLQRKINLAGRDIKKIQGRYPEKSLVQLLRRIRMEAGLLASMLVILRVERTQKKKLSQEDLIFLAEERKFISEGAPLLEKELKEAICLR